MHDDLCCSLPHLRPGLIDAACYGELRVHGNHLNGIFSQTHTHTHISEKHLLRATAEEDRPIDRTDTKRRENMQKGIALSHTELVSCNLPHEPACSIRGMEVFFSLVYIYKATLKLIRIHSFAIDIVMLIEYYSSVI